MTPGHYGTEGQIDLGQRFAEANLAAIGVPEPSTFVLAALGLLGLGWYGWRRRKQAE